MFVQGETVGNLREISKQNRNQIHTQITFAFEIWLYENSCFFFFLNETIFGKYSISNKNEWHSNDVKGTSSNSHTDQIVTTPQQFTPDYHIHDKP